MDELLTIQDVSRYLQVGKGTIYNWINRKNFPRKKIGRLVRFNRTDVEEWVARQTQKADEEILAKQKAHPRLGRHDSSQSCKSSEQMGHFWL